MIILGWSSREGQGGRPSTRMFGPSHASPPGRGLPQERTWLSTLIPLFVRLAVILVSGGAGGEGAVALPEFRSTVLLNAEAKCEHRGAGGAAAHVCSPAGMLLEELQGLSGGDHPARGGRASPPFIRLTVCSALDKIT